MKIPSPNQDYPPRWDIYRNLVGVAGPAPMGFAGSIADINRFGARYKAAKTFRRVEFEGVSVDTADGYSALCQILLTYSAFEHLLKCIGIPKNDTQQLLTREERDRFQSRLRNLSGQRDLFIIVHEFVNSLHKVEIEKHISGQRCNPFFLASAIRHSFAHGVLAATPVRAPQRSVATVSRFLTRLLMKVMEREFENRMIDFKVAFEESFER